VFSSPARALDSQPLPQRSFLFFARVWQPAKRQLQLPPVTVRPPPLFLLSGHVWPLAKLQFPQPETPPPQLFYAHDVLQATQPVIQPELATELAQRRCWQRR
jgi:hypothetical protein